MLYETWGERKLFMANCALPPCRVLRVYNTQTKRVAFNVTKLLSGSGAEGEVHCSATNGTGECAGEFYMSCSMKPKEQIFSIQVIHISDILSPVSPLHVIDTTSGVLEYHRSD